MKRIIRDRYLTAAEAAKYDTIREKVKADLPDLIAQHERHMATTKQANDGFKLGEPQTMKGNGPTPKLADNDLGTEVNLPGALAMAFMSDRPELCAMWTGPMDAIQAANVVVAMGVLMQRNRDLRDKLARLRKVVETGLPEAMNQMKAIAKRVADMDKDVEEILTLVD